MGMLKVAWIHRVLDEKTGMPMVPDSRDTSGTQSDATSGAGFGEASWGKLAAEPEAEPGAEPGAVQVDGQVAVQVDVQEAAPEAAPEAERGIEDTGNTGTEEDTEVSVGAGSEDSTGSAEEEDRGFCIAVAAGLSAAEIGSFHDDPSSSSFSRHAFRPQGSSTVQQR